ncbi:hypothetical protein N7462_002397 [Penicillium macrosclerotiorum]|uniref:uncharacterized protein n=1 Tax=Penicillium macrosclerotiorum TaxID=303699 RepID=UPI0025480619|nr:uncharacterized protein N7462_002397 [Penicillium macrosclerotiorum]KAJ5692974.1 hypothetical protein N7462_002397 [Penicillium macrosclerotiorum]
MSKSRTGLYIGLAAAGGAGYYLYRAGGDVRGAKNEMKSMSPSRLPWSRLGREEVHANQNPPSSVDADKAREKLPRGSDAEKMGQNAGKEAGATVDEAVLAPFIRPINNARTKTKLDERIPAMAEDGKKKLDGLRQDARDQINATVDKVDRTVEEKASDAKGTVSGWFGGKK